MLRYFRINDPYRLVGLAGIAGLLFLAVLVDPPGLTLPELRSIVIGEKVTDGSKPYVQLIDPTPPLTAWVYGLASWALGEDLYIRHVLSFLIMLSQAIYFGLVCINRKAFPDNTFVPSLVFVILFAFSADTLSLTGELFGLGFLLLALNAMFRELEFRSKTDETILAIGTHISLASLFYLPYWLFIWAAALMVIFYSRRDLRIFLLLFTGFALPHLLLFSVYFVAGDHDQLWAFFYLPNLSVGRDALMSPGGLMILSAIPLAFFATALVFLNRDARFSKYQSQVIQTMFIWTLFAAVQLVFAKSLRPQSLICLIPALSFFITHLLLLIHRRRIAEILLWCLLAGVAAMQLMTRYRLLPAVNYATLIVAERPAERITGKKILVLSDDLSYYRNNRLATPFFNWKLSRPILEEPGYYDHVIWLNEGFKNDPPDVIIDPENHMGDVFESIPLLKSQYTASEPGVLTRRN